MLLCFLLVSVYASQTGSFQPFCWVWCRVSFLLWSIGQRRHQTLFDDLCQRLCEFACNWPLTSLFADQSASMTQAESCRPPPYSPMHVDLSPILLGGEGDLASPLLPASAPIDLASLNPELLKEVQHVVIAREDLLLHVHEIIGRGGTIHYFM